jgi:hypothetical protein
MILVAYLGMLRTVRIAYGTLFEDVSAVDREGEDVDVRASGRPL